MQDESYAASRIQQLAETHKELLQKVREVADSIVVDHEAGTIFTTKEMKNTFDEATSQMRKIRVEIRSLGGSTDVYDFMDAFNERFPNFYSPRSL